ncbi:MAG: BGTF surface domain-containing protein [Halobacterium sp.]
MNQTLSVLVAALVALSVLGVGAAPVAAQQETASLGDSYVEVTRGETVAISVSHSAAANLTIGADSEGFEVVVPLGGSGTDTVEFDTYRSTSSNPDDFLSVNGATMKTPPIDEAIEPGQYTLTVTIDGVTEAVGNLEVKPRKETTGKPGVLPGSVDFEEDGASAAWNRATHRQSVAVGDYAAFVVNESGLGSAFGENPSVASLADEGIRMRVTELDPEPNTEAETYTGSDLRVVSKVPERDKFVVVWDTSGIDLGSRSNHTYEYRLWLDETNPLVSSEETLVRERVTLSDPSVRLRADPGFRLDPWDGDRMVVNGTTNLAPTTSLDVRALQETPMDYLWKNVVTVSADGTFSATFDFSQAERPGSFPLWVLHYKDESRHMVRLTAANGTLLFPSQTEQNGTVTVENVTLSEGGFVQLTANNSSVGVTDPLPAGDHGSLTVALNATLDGPTNVTATALVDANGNGQLDDSDPVYGSWATPARDTAVIRPAVSQNDSNGTVNTTTAPTTPTNTTANATANATTEQQTTIQVAESAPLAPAASNGGGSSGGSVPLSPVATLVAVAAAALLALRRGPDRL